LAETSVASVDPHGQECERTEGAKVKFKTWWRDRQASLAGRWRALRKRGRAAERKLGGNSSLDPKPQSLAPSGSPRVPAGPRGRPQPTRAGEHETQPVGCAKFDSLIARAESAIALMQERRTALISAAVTGKIDVRHWHPPVVSKLETTPFATA